MRSLSRHLFAFLCVCLLTTFSGLGVGCSGKEVNENDPASLFEDAEAEIKSDRYQLAIDRLRMIKARFPYSKYGALAQLRIGDVYFLQESFGEAAVSYETFRDLHPKHEKAAYAIFRIGEAYRSDIPSTVARDLGSAAKAQEAYEDYLRRFPTGESASAAGQHIGEIKLLMAEKENYVAQFYIKGGKPEAARQRLKKIIDQFPGSASAEQAKKSLESLPKVEAPSGN